MNKLSASVVCLVLVNVCYSQKAAVRGNVSDSFNHQYLANVSVCLLQAKDSVLQAFTRTNAQGDFQLQTLHTGNFLLMITAPGFADFVDAVTITDSLVLNFPPVYLQLKARLLEDVVVRQTVAAIKIKGDTTEYTADSFKVMPGASVEDLLKKLPGLQVDRNGKIIAYNQTVEKILVDGEEFFSDDPTLVTRNFRADMIDKVQVYDKKSDQTVLTGIDDGKKTTTLNLKLKEEKKQGYLGKISAATGTEGFHDLQAMFNVFKNKMRLAAYGIRSTTGTTGLNWSDNNSFGDERQPELDDVTGYMVSYNRDEGWDGAYQNAGLPTVNTAGITFGNKWHDDKQKLNGTYKMQDLQIKEADESRSQTLLADSAFFRDTRRSVYKNAYRHTAGGRYEIALDSSSYMVVKAGGNYSHIETQENELNRSLSQEFNPVNEGLNSQTMTKNLGGFNSNIVWRKKLAKKGRTLSASFSQNFKKSDHTGFLDATTTFYNTSGNIDSVQQLNQMKEGFNEQLSLDINAAYTEPLSARSAIQLNYGVAVNNNQSGLSSFNKVNDKYEAFDSSFSTSYRFNVFTHKTGVTYMYNRKKIRFTAGTNIGITSFKQNDDLRNTVMKRDFINWFPQASLAYSMGMTQRLSIEYNGRTQQPTIESIQPLTNNNNPLHVVIGNPDLKPLFRNSISLAYSKFNVLKKSRWFSQAYFSSTHNDIGSRDVVDNTGKTTSQMVNLNGNWYASLRADYFVDLKKGDFTINPSTNLELNKNFSYVNGILNETSSNSYGADFAFGQNKEKYEWRLTAGAAFATSRSSVQQQEKTNYWIYNITPYAAFPLPFKITLRTDAEILLQQKLRPQDPNNNRVLWNMSLEKKMFKGDVLLLRLSVNDLLNQNNGFNRSIGTGYIAESTRLTIRRYGLLSVVWNFNKMGAGNK